MSSVQAPQAQRLEQAFGVFNTTAEALCRSYGELSARVASLTEELALANGELRRQYAEKHALSQRLAFLLEMLPAGVLSIDGAGRVAEANPLALQLLGEPLVGLPWRSLQRTRLRPACSTGQWLRRTGSAGTQPRRMTLAERSLPDSGARILVLQDVTEAHEREQTLQRSQRLSAMGEMAAALAHRLRTPLSTALLYAAQLRGGPLPAAERERFAGKAVERLRHLERLIGDMLLFARGESESREPVAVDGLVREAEQTIAAQAQARAVRLQVRDASAGTILHASRRGLSGALLALLENALQACKAGGEVRLRAERRGASLVLAVRDSGAGVAPEARERLFEPFFTTRAEGTGLGLAIVRGVAQAHGGTVAVRTPAGGGTEFVLELPLEAAEAQTLAA